MKKCLVLGAGGFIGSHMVKRLKSEGAWVRGVDLKEPHINNNNAYGQRKLLYNIWELHNIA